MTAFLVVLAFAFGLGLGVFVTSMWQWWQTRQRRKMLIRTRREMAEATRERPYDEIAEEEREARRELFRQWQDEWPM